MAIYMLKIGKIQTYSIPPWWKENAADEKEVGDDRFVCSRPRTVDDVAHQEEVVAVKRKILEGSDVRVTISF